MNIKPKFTREQIDWICWQIGDWYLDWRDCLVNWKDKQHRFGYAKELLKEKLFPSEDSEPFLQFKIPKFIGDLPNEYTYKIISVGGQVRILGVSLDKSPIGFYIDENFKLIRMDF